MKNPSVIFMGSKPGSVIALSMLIEREWNVLSVVVSPKKDRPWIEGPSLQEFAEKEGLPVITRQSDLPESLKADFVISYMFRYRVKGETLGRAERAAVNFHAGPLPEYGGWAFYNLAILENAEEYGCTCHYMDEGFDTGPLLRVRRFPIKASEETAFSLERKAQGEMLELFKEFCDLAEGDAPLPREEQDPSKMRYLTEEQFEALKEIPGDADEETVERHARAFWYPPYPGAYKKVEGKRVDVIPRCIQGLEKENWHADDLTYLKNYSIFRQENS